MQAIRFCPTAYNFVMLMISNRAMDDCANIPWNGNCNEEWETLFNIAYFWSYLHLLQSIIYILDIIPFLLFLKKEKWICTNCKLGCI